MNITKIIPPRPSHTLERERLLDRLHSWEDKKLIIIHAQAGQGKSTLAAGYVSSLARPSVWYNMDQEDDNPAVFLSCLGQAVQRAWPDHVPRLPLIPEGRYGPGVLRKSVNSWISQVFGNIPSSGLVVFDDCHNSSYSVALQDIFPALLDSTPPHVRFMLISRSRPGMEIAKLRAKKAVGEISGDELRFNDSETHDLFCNVFGMQLARNEAARINRTTEGWPAGLVLMHECLAAAPESGRLAERGDQKPAEFQTHIFDYLAQEVFSRLPATVRDFLLRTSISDELPSPLIEKLTGLPTTAKPGKPSVAAIIHELRSRNLFVSTSDEAAGVVRYHALFRDFLLKKLHAEARPAEIKKLYLIATDYFKWTGDAVRAVNLSLASGQFRTAAGLMEDCGRELLARGQTRTLLRWIGELPLNERDRPWFLFYRAVAGRFTAPGTSLELLDRALAGFRKEQRPRHRIVGQMLSLCGIIEACFHMGGDFTRMGLAAARAQTLLKGSGRESPEARARLLLAMGMAWFFIGRLRQGSDALRQALDQFRKKGDHFYQITCAIYLTPCALYQGDFSLAKEAVRKGFEAQAALPDESGGRAALFLVKAMTALFEGNFGEAQESIDHCRDLSDSQALESIGFLSLDIGGWLKIAQGDYHGAEDLLRECKRNGEEAQNAFFSSLAAHFLAIAYMFQDKLDKAKTESDYALSIQARSRSRLFHGIYLIASGAIHLKLGKRAQAEKELLIALKMLQQIKAVQQEANAHLMLARVYEKRRKPDLARKHLQEGFSIGQERGFTYYALFNAAELSELAREALAHGICAEYCAGLLESISKTHDVPRLRVHCLGGFRVQRDRTVIRDAEWKSKRAKALLKLLLSQDRQKVSRDIVMELLWPDTTTDNLPMTFNSMLYRARKVLDPDAVSGKENSCIIQEGELLSLNPKAVWTDVGQFIAHIETAGRLKTKNDQAKVLGEYEKAFSVYHGDFLPDDLYAEWANSMRDRLRLLYFKALQDAAELAENMGGKDKAASFTDKIFSADPCNEAACRRLMTRHLSNGLRGEAIRTYEQCERALRRELDLEPEERTKKLYRSIIGG